MTIYYLISDDDIAAILNQCKVIDRGIDKSDESVKFHLGSCTHNIKATLKGIFECNVVPNTEEDDYVK